MWTVRLYVPIDRWIAIHTVLFVEVVAPPVPFLRRLLTIYLYKDIER